jgi:hypothetical protein
MKHLKNTRKDTQDKWDNLIGNMGLTGSKATWMSQYTGLQSQNTSTSSSFTNILPIAMKVSAKTIGLDLVSVQPMSAPSGILPYIDYQYGDTKHKTRKRKINNIFKVNE